MTTKKTESKMRRGKRTTTNKCKKLLASETRLEKIKKKRKKKQIEQVRTSTNFILWK